jgi:hypothetical protein
MFQASLSLIAPRLGRDMAETWKIAMPSLTLLDAQLDVPLDAPLQAWGSARLKCLSAWQDKRR